MYTKVDTIKHLQAAMHWLAVAQDARVEDRGISAYFHLFKGWQSSYPETTGYIINTFLDYGKFSNDESWNFRAKEAGNWLLSLQLKNDGFPGGVVQPNPQPRVFNTGMILFGLTSLSQQFQDKKYITAGLKAVDWLVQSQDSDGSWKMISPEKLPHVYHSRVAWGMLFLTKEYFKNSIPGKYLDSITKLNEWVCTQQESTGWFRNNELIPGLQPFTHNIAYTLRGLFEVGFDLNRQDFIKAAIIPAKILMDDYFEHGWLSATYGPGWKRAASFRCLTGEAQMGLVWARIAQLTGEKEYLLAAKKSAVDVMKTQWIKNNHPESVYGGVPGAWPIWGSYLRFGYPNWAAKFLADLIMMLENL